MRNGSTWIETIVRVCLQSGHAYRANQPYNQLMATEWLQNGHHMVTEFSPYVHFIAATSATDHNPHGISTPSLKYKGFEPMTTW